MGIAADHRLVDRMLQQMPNLQPLVADSIESEDAISPLAFMSNLPRHVQALWARIGEDPRATAEVEAILSFLEREVEKDPIHARALIGMVSSNLPSRARIRRRACGQPWGPGCAPKPRPPVLPRGLRPDLRDEAGRPCENPSHHIRRA